MEERKRKRHRQQRRKLSRSPRAPLEIDTREDWPQHLGDTHIHFAPLPERLDVTASTYHALADPSKAVWNIGSALRGPHCQEGARCPSRDKEPGLQPHQRACRGLLQGDPLGDGDAQGGTAWHRFFLLFLWGFFRFSFLSGCAGPCRSMNSAASWKQSKRPALFVSLHQGPYTVIRTAGSVSPTLDTIRLD